MVNIIYDEYEHLAVCEGCASRVPTQQLREADGYLFCPDCVEDMAERQNDHRDYEGSV